MAWWLFTDETFYVYYTAQKNLFYCPSETLNLDLEFQYCWAMLSVSYNDVNKYISWSPIGDMQTIIVYNGSNYEIKWFINSENGGFPSPVTYPNVPGGATQLIPEIGTAASIESGDMISVYSTSGAEYDGHECVSFGDFIVE